MTTQAAGFQLDILWENKTANRATVRRMLDDARLPPGALVALPEMFSTGFSMNVAAIAEDPGGATEAFLAGEAAERGLYLLGGVVTRDPDGRGRNEAVVRGPDGREIARYAKMHPFTYAGEAEHYGPGNAPALFAWGEWTVAPFICYDLRFPEVFRDATIRGAQLFVVIANWPDARESHWTTLLRARAVENQCCVLAVNRCGRDPNLAYSGRSLLLDARGEILADAGNGPGVIAADLDLAALLDYRRAFPVLADIRPEYVRTPAPRWSP